MNLLLPFTAVVGQDEAKLALLLSAVDRSIGGVLLRGDKGSAKSTLARGLAALLPGDAPFVELPLGATEDRVVGTLDLTAALTGGEVRFSPGLLYDAEGGVLYVDEINLLPDHLVDVLLDVAASGVNRVEREGVSHSHPSRFLLIGSMNPEEGDLRPQLLDRFGLAVEVRTAVEASERAMAVNRRLEFDQDPDRFRARFAPDERSLAARLAAAKPAPVDPDTIGAVSALCVSMGAEGLRADLTICRAAAALAGWDGRARIEADDIRRVAPMALAHRARRDPLDPGGVDRQKLDDALDDHLGETTADGDVPPSGDSGSIRPPTDPRSHTVVPTLSAARDRQRRQPSSGRRTIADAPRGHLVGDRQPDGPIGPVAVGATVRQAAARRLASTDLGRAEPLVEVGDLREAVRVQRSANLIVIAVDASGSMGAPQRMEAAKGAVLTLLVDAYQKRDLVALVAFRDDGAETLLRPTSSVEVARARLGELPTGGRTPLAAGIAAGLKMAQAPGRAQSHHPLLVLITDGRATASPSHLDPVDAAHAAADAVRRSGVSAVVIDVEGDRGPRLGLARRLAERMGAEYVALTALSPVAISDAVRQSTHTR